MDDLTDQGGRRYVMNTRFPARLGRRMYVLDTGFPAGCDVGVKVTQELDLGVVDQAAYWDRLPSRLSRLGQIMF